MTEEEIDECKIQNTLTTKMSFDFFRNIKKHVQIKALKICRFKRKMKDLDAPGISNSEHHDTQSVQDKTSSVLHWENMPQRSIAAANSNGHCSNNMLDVAESENGCSSSVESTRSLDESSQNKLHKTVLDINNPEASSEIEADHPEVSSDANQSQEREHNTPQISRSVIRNTVGCLSSVHEDNAQALPAISNRLPKDNEVKASVTEELVKYGWYWGPISGDEADAKLISEPDGAFLVRDSSDDRYILTLSFKSSGKLLHARMEHSKGLFSLCNQSDAEGFTSVPALIHHSMNFSQSAVFCYSRPKYPGYPAFPVRLTKPVSRFTQVQSLQYLCCFVIRQNIRLDNIRKLPLPETIIGYIEQARY